MLILDDSYVMMRAIEQARRSSRVKKLLPPYVGAVVAKDNEIVGEGYKRFLSSYNILLLHAERDAITNARNRTQGSALYTTLQPCIRKYKRVFQSCSELIAEAGIKRVVIGLNPSRRLNTESIRFMQENGIEVVLFDDGLQDELNRLRWISSTIYIPT